MKLSVSGVMCCMLAAMLLLDLAASAPNSPDYDSLRELYELLVAREGGPAGQGLWDGHKVVRKSPPSNRSPQLRLRFGRRSDPSFLQFADHGAERPLFDSLDN